MDGDEHQRARLLCLVFGRSTIPNLGAVGSNPAGDATFSMGYLLGIYLIAWAGNQAGSGMLLLSMKVQ